MTSAITQMKVTDSKFLDGYLKFKRLFVDVPYSPFEKKPYQLAFYYIKSNNYLNLQCIFDYVKNSQIQQNLLIRGERGSGKTALINYWLYEHHEELEQNNIFWVRCDAEELYNLWINDVHFQFQQGRNIEGRYVDMTEFFDIRFVYIFAKHCFINNNNKFLQRILNLINEKNPQYEYRIGRYDLCDTVTKPIYEGIKEINNYNL